MIINPYISFPTAAYTARTTAFATATGIVDATLLNGLSTYDTAQISNGLNALSFAEYVNVGGTATTCKFNFANPLDTDAAFRKVTTGGATFNNSGVTYNGTNAYDNTYFNGATNELLNNQSYAVLIGSGSSTANTVEFGYASSADSYRGSFMYWGNSTTDIYWANKSIYNLRSLAFSTTGFWLMTRSSDTIYIYKNGVLFDSFGYGGSNASSSLNFFFGCRNVDGGASNFTTSQHQYQWIGKALDATQQLNLYNNVLALQAIK